MKRGGAVMTAGAAEQTVGAGPRPAQGGAAASCPASRDSRRPEPQAVTCTEPETAGPLSPLVRRMAREHNIDLAKIRGTGAGGRITKQDIEAYLCLRSRPRKPAAPAARAPRRKPPPTAAGPPGAEGPRSSR